MEENEEIPTVREAVINRSKRGLIVSVDNLRSRESDARQTRQPKMSETPTGRFSVCREAVDDAATIRARHYLGAGAFVSSWVAIACRL